jgi:hypothetical protein
VTTSRSSAERLIDMVDAAFPLAGIRKHAAPAKPSLSLPLPMAARGEYPILISFPDRINPYDSVKRWLNLTMCLHNPSAPHCVELTRRGAHHVRCQQ